MSYLSVPSTRPSILSCEIVKRQGSWTYNRALSNIVTCRNPYEYSQLVSKEIIVSLFIVALKWFMVRVSCTWSCLLRAVATKRVTNSSSQLYLQSPLIGRDDDIDLMSALNPRGAPSLDPSYWFSPFSYIKQPIKDKPSYPPPSRHGRAQRWRSKNQRHWANKFWLATR